MQEAQPLRPHNALKKATPVALPPGRLRLTTKPCLTGSLPIMKQMGIVDVAVFAASAAGRKAAAITVTLWLTRSAARCGSRWY